MVWKLEKLLGVSSGWKKYFRLLGLMFCFVFFGGYKGWQSYTDVGGNIVYSLKYRVYLYVISYILYSCISSMFSPV